MRQSSGKIIVNRLETRSSEHFGGIMLKEEYSSLCPSCGQVLLRTCPDGFIVPGRKTWMNDGDAILGIEKKLPTDQRKNNAYRFSLWVGQCPSCNADYYAIECLLIDAPLSEDLEDFLNYNGPMGRVENFVCELLGGPKDLPKDWVMSAYQTPNGPMHSHTFGPFRLESPDELIHPEYGVMSCISQDAEPWKHGEYLILSLFDKMRHILRSATRRDS